MSNIPEGIRLNRPTDLGREVGALLAERVQPEIEMMKGLGIPDLRCNSCAFRKGTVPNGCEPTIMDALKCGMEGVAFMCHEDKGGDKFCHGWVAIRSAMKAEKQECPWPFSDEGEPTVTENPLEEQK